MNSESPTKAARWPLLRVQPGHDVAVELLSGDWVRLSTHYFKRTFLCSEDERCECCQLLPSRSYWYLPAIELPGRRATLIEFSAAASSDLEQHGKLLSGKLGPGLQVRLTRRTQKSSVKSEIFGQASVGSRVHLHDWVSALGAIYGLPPMRADETIEGFGDRVKESLITRAAVVAAQIQASNSSRSKGR